MYVVRIQGVDAQFPSVVIVNVGGTLFTTALSTLRRFPDSLLGSMFSGRHQILRDEDGHPFIDADPIYFRYVLEYLRTEAIPPEDLARGVYKTASYFAIEPLRERLLLVPEVARMLVKELSCNRFSRYGEIKQRAIKLAIERAAVDPSNSGLVKILVKLRRKHAQKVEPRIGDFANVSDHMCVRETADIQKDEDAAAARDFSADSMYDEEFISCIQQDLADAGFNTNVSFHVCTFGCPYAIAEIGIQF